MGQCSSAFTSETRRSSCPNICSYLLSDKRSIMAIAPLQAERRPCILYRTEVWDERHLWFNKSFDEAGNMVSRNPHTALNRRTMRRHLDISNRHPTPLLSFSSSWDSALARRRRYINHGAGDVSIIAIWVDSSDEIYDAYNEARELGLPNFEQYLDEYLVHHAVAAQEYSILAIFRGIAPEADAQIVLPRCRSTIPVPGGLPLLITDWIRQEMYAHTGVYNDLKLYTFLCSLSRIPVQKEMRNGQVRLKCLAPYFLASWTFNDV
ncbi:hypothetical protein BDZ85DRAFT_260650 [Elsinoe ampelina]|uniref:DUF7587 domain-containing protein n=1 Tax=Elsinoe ampelina TaxID=302913 RepID=A0A6A6GF00_9PEZI|nr:hypothetical protein BDZ85DRAFT_260650 [Elsinoe ampelina]